MQTIAVLTSGGDSAGMNAALRAVVRAALTYRLRVFGVKRGYEGLIENDMVKMNYDSVAGILSQGGTILYSARSEEFYTEEGRKKAAANLKKRDIDGLVVIGGDGSFQGAHTLYKEHGFAVIGVPITYLRMKDEERMMIEQFGSDYEEYMKKTGRIFPKL